MDSTPRSALGLLRVASCGLPGLLDLDDNPRATRNPQLATHQDNSQPLPRHSERGGWAGVKRRILARRSRNQKKLARSQPCCPSPRCSFSAAGSTYKGGRRPGEGSWQVRNSFKSRRLHRAERGEEKPRATRDFFGSSSSNYAVRCVLRVACCAWRVARAVRPGRQPPVNSQPATRHPPGATRNSPVG